MTSLNRARKRPDGIDADFFIDAQDFDETWEKKHLHVKEPGFRVTRATASVTLKGTSFDDKLRVGLRKEGGVWKIDNVNGRANP